MAPDDDGIPEADEEQQAAKEVAKDMSVYLVEDIMGARKVTIKNEGAAHRACARAGIHARGGVYRGGRVVSDVRHWRPGR